MTTKNGNFALRLPISLKEKAERMAADEGVSLNQLITLAVAEKINTAEAIVEWIEQRRARSRVPSDYFRRRFVEGGKGDPLPGDAWPDDLSREEVLSWLKE